MINKNEALAYELSVLVYRDLIHYWEDYLRAFSSERVPSYDSFLRSCSNQEALSLLFGLTIKQLEAVLGPVGIDWLGVVGEWRKQFLNDEKIAA